MALPHGVSGQPLDVEPLGSALSTARSAALFKSRDLEVMRLVLLTGKSLPPHQVAGDITIHCLEGTLHVEMGDAALVLRAGQLVFLTGGVVHAVTAVTDASALVTIALK